MTSPSIKRSRRVGVAASLSLDEHLGSRAVNAKAPERPTEPSRTVRTRLISPCCLDLSPYNCCPVARPKTPWGIPGFTPMPQCYEGGHGALNVPPLSIPNGHRFFSHFTDVSSIKSVDAMGRTDAGKRCVVKGRWIGPGTATGAGPRQGKSGRCSRAGQR
jgi:hypothetical protein